MDSPEQPSIAATLDLMWTRFLPQLQDRIGLLEQAAAAATAGELTLDQRSEANEAAHKLAGVLGTFGLTRGTVLAREAEMLCAEEPDGDPEKSVRLGEIAAQLRSMIQNRAPAQPPSDQLHS